MFVFSVVARPLVTHVLDQALINASNALARGKRSFIFDMVARAECRCHRFNLNGTCVGYDGSNGICDSSSTRLNGVYVANNAKGRCEACPSGCLACAIPSFSILSVWNDTVCTACQEGWVLQDGKCVQECTVGFFLPEGAPNINGTCEGQRLPLCYCTGTR